MYFLYQHGRDTAAIFMFIFCLKMYSSFPDKWQTSVSNATWYNFPSHAHCLLFSDSN